MVCNGSNYFYGKLHAYRCKSLGRELRAIVRYNFRLSAKAAHLVLQEDSSYFCCRCFRSCYRSFKLGETVRH